MSDRRSGQEHEPDSGTRATNRRNGDEASADRVDEPSADGSEETSTEAIGEGSQASDDGAESLPNEAFEVLGHEIRLRIVETLAECRRDNWHWTGERFSTLRKAVGIRDAGKFSYHLERLQPEFVVKEDEEYKLTFAGMQVAGAVVAGIYGESHEQREAQINVECQICGDRMLARYGYEYCRLVCPTHGEFYGNTLPPGAAEDRSMDELVALADREAVRDVQRARDGACPHCWGRMRTSLPAEDVMPDPETGERLDDWESLLGERASEVTLVQFSCDRCGMTFWVPPGTCIVTHPAVAGFCYEHGVNVRETPMAGLPFTYSGVEELTSADPVRVRVDVELDGDRLSVWLDDQTNVVETEGG